MHSDSSLQVPAEAQRAPIGAWALEEPEPPEGPDLKTELKTRDVDGFARPPPMPPWSHLRARFVKRLMVEKS